MNQEKSFGEFLTDVFLYFVKKYGDRSSSYELIRNNSSVKETVFSLHIPGFQIPCAIGLHKSSLVSVTFYEIVTPKEYGQMLRYPFLQFSATYIDSNLLLMNVSDYANMPVPYCIKNPTVVNSLWEEIRFNFFDLYPPQLCTLPNVQNN